MSGSNGQHWHAKSYEQGQKARRAGQPHTACPYQEHARKFMERFRWVSWQEGWKAQDAVSTVATT